MNRRIIAAVVATLLALIGAGLVFVYAKNADQRAVAAAQPSTVWVAKAAVPVGTTLGEALSGDLISETRVAAQAVPLGSLESVDATNKGLQALSDIAPGEYLLSARFGTAATGERAIEVPPGQLAVSVELTDPARVGTFVTPGTHIAIFASYKIKALGDDPASKKINDNDIKGTRPLLDDVLVIGMGDTALSAPSTVEGKPSDGSSSFLVTVAVKPDQATRLIHGINNYTLYAGVRGANVKIDPKAGITDLTVFPAVAP